MDSSLAQRDSLTRLYQDFGRESFRWLVAEAPAAAALVHDVVDTLRALRCADALRHRGTVLKTSGSYEIFVDQMTASALFALRKGDNELSIMEMPKPLSAGEANLASSELSPDGNLRGAIRNATIISEEDVQLLMIPKEGYLKHWHQPYTLDELLQRLSL